MNGKPIKKEEDKVNLLAERGRGTDVAVQDFGADAGAGMENVTADELRVPFLYVLDAKSPQVLPASQGGLPGARAGMLFNTGTGELYDGEKGVEVVPVHRDHNYVEFTPKNLGGGFVAVYPPDDEYVARLKAKQGKFGRLFTGTKRDDKGMPLDGTEISETFYLYVVLIDPDTGAWSRVVVPFKSTQIKKYQAFMQRQTTFKYQNPNSTTENPLPPVQPPIWAHRWRLGSRFEKNKKGDFFGWTLSLAERNEDGTEAPYFKSLVKTSDPLYHEAKAFNEMLKKGAAQADYAKAPSEAAEGDDPPM